MVFPTQLLISYVESLELATSDKGVSSSAANAVEQDEASVVGAITVGFPKGLDQKLVADIQNSTLFAQFAANAKFNKTDQAHQWYDFYKNVLENVGWGVHAFEWTKVEDAGTHVSVDKLLLELVAAYLGPGEIKIAKGIVDALSKGANSGALSIFDKSTINNNKANFQLSVGGESGGSAVLKAGAYVYSVKSNIVHVLFTKFGSQSVNFEYNTQSMILNDGVYSTVRQKIIDQLGSHAVDFIAHLPISPSFSV